MSDCLTIFTRHSGSAFNFVISAKHWGKRIVGGCRSPLTIVVYPYNLLATTDLRKLPDFSSESRPRLIFATTEPDKIADELRR